MTIIKAHHGQNLYDLAIQHHGSVDGGLESLMMSNDISPSDICVSQQAVNVNNMVIVNQVVISYFKNKKTYPITGL